MNIEKVLLENQKDDSLYGKVLRWKQRPVELDIPREKIDEAMLKNMLISRGNGKWNATQEKISKMMEEMEESLKRVAECNELMAAAYIDLMNTPNLNIDDYRKFVEMGFEVDGDVAYLIGMDLNKREE